jgi:hypothetical protein
MPEEFTITNRFIMDLLKYPITNTTESCGEGEVHTTALFQAATNSGSA